MSKTVEQLGGNIEIFRGRKNKRSKELQGLDLYFLVKNCRKFLQSGVLRDLYPVFLFIPTKKYELFQKLWPQEMFTEKLKKKNLKSCVTYNFYHISCVWSVIYN